MDFIPRRLSLELKRGLLIVDYEQRGKWRRRQMPCRHRDEYTANQLVAVLKHRHQPILDRISEEQLLRFIQAMKESRIPIRRPLNVSGDPLQDNHVQAADDISYLLDKSEELQEKEKENVQQNEENQEDDDEVTSHIEEVVEEEVVSDLADEEEPDSMRHDHTDNEDEFIPKNEIKSDRLNAGSHSELTTLVPLAPVVIERNQSTGSIDRLLDGFGQGHTDDEQDEYVKPVSVDVKKELDDANVHPATVDFGAGDTDDEEQDAQDDQRVGNEGIDQYEADDFDPMSEEIQFSDNGLDALSDGGRPKVEEDDAF